MDGVRSPLNLWLLKHTLRPTPRSTEWWVQHTDSTITMISIGVVL